MKKLYFISGVLMVGTLCYGQTNRINHFSHSGQLATINIFKSNDNMGCGQINNLEIKPTAPEAGTIKWDSTFKDTTNQKVIPRQNQNSLKPLEQKVDTSSIHNKSGR